MITAWRIVDARYADDVFSGEGARLHGARWHKRGHRVIYTSSSISLATLELIVNTPRARLLSDFVISSCTFPEVLVEDVDEAQLPTEWRDFPRLVAVQDLGMTWLTRASSAVLSVPSAVTPEERNYLLNPEHEHFRSVQAGASRPFTLDLRLLT